jgi:hypothetical protein
MDLTTQDTAKTPQLPGNKFADVSQSKPIPDVTVDGSEIWNHKFLQAGPGGLKRLMPVANRSR